jgi:predicted RNase H-like nuclease (RuvC/YqgF family)
METHVLILFGFLLLLICALGLDSSASKYDIRTLRARLDRRDAVTTSPVVRAIKDSAEWAAQVNEFAKTIKDRQYHIKQLEAELEAVGHRNEKQEYALKIRIGDLGQQLDEKNLEIEHLNGDIAKLKFDYAAEVAGRNDKIVVERDTFDIQTISDAEKSALLYGEWVDNAGPQKVREEKGCTDPDCSVCYGDKNAESPNLDEEVDD